MSQPIQLDAFLDAMYRDSYLKSRIILWTFLLLVFPAAFLIAGGVPEKAFYVGLVGLLLPLLFGVFAFFPRIQTRDTQEVWAQPPDIIRHSPYRDVAAIQYVDLHVLNLVMPSVSGADMLAALKLQTGTMHHLRLVTNASNAQIDATEREKVVESLVKLNKTELLLLQAEMQRKESCPSLQISASMDGSACISASAPV